MIKLILILISQLFNLSFEQLNFDESFLKHMNSNTDYNLVANKKNFHEFIIPECKQIGFWHLVRYGANYPNYEDIEEFNDFLPKLRDSILLLNQSSLDQNDLEILKNWKTKFTSENENLLTIYGNYTMKLLGQRFWSRLKNLISESRINKQIKIQSTDYVWTRQSAEKYIEGFFNFWPFKINVETISPEEDYLLKFNDLCDKYLLDINSDQTACSEILTFDFMSFKLRNLKKKFQNRLGVNSFYTNINKAFELSFKLCQNEYLLDKTVSIWCKFFDEETVKLLEYKEDLKANCKYGYKYDISRLMTCDLIENLLTSLHTFKNGYENSSDSHNKFTVYFTHGSTILSFLASIGVGKSNNNFDYENILNENADRKYKTSLINPINSNIGFLLYKCSEISNKPKYLLRTFLNENLIKPDGCQSSDCNLFEFMNYLKFFTSICKSTRETCKI